MKKIVVIGSGIGGLVAANLLAIKGHKVILFEAHSSPGGYIGGFKRKGYYFESGTLAFESSREIFQVMKEINVYDQIEFVKKEPHRFISNDFDKIIDSWDDMRELLYTSYPDEKKQIDLFFKELDPIIKEFNTIMSLPSPILTSGLKKILSGLLFLIKGGKFIKIIKQYGMMTIPEFVGQFFKQNSKIYNFFATMGYPDMGCIGLAGMMHMFNDYWTVKNGMQSWADVMVQNFKKNKGQLMLKTYVDSIVTKNNTAIGVKAGNNFYEADYVLSAGDYKKTFLQLLDNPSLIPDDLRKKIKESPVSESFFTVYVGLTLSNEELKKSMKAAALVLSDTETRADSGNPQDKDFFSKCPLFVYSPSMINDQLAPAGKSSLMLQAITPPGWMNNWGGGDKEKYQALKKQVIETMIKRTQQLIPELSSCIDYSDAATPLTYERFAHNTDGASCSWSWNPKKNFYPAGVMMKTTTPVKNLYISSCWATPQGGIPGAVSAGYSCAKKIG